MQKNAWVFAALGGLLGVIFGSLWYVYGEIDSNTRLVGIAAALCFAGYAALDRDTLTEGANSRTARNGMMSVLMVFVATAVGIYGVKLAQDHDTRWDWTGAKRFTLSQESIAVAKGLNRPVSIKAFFARESPGERNFRELVEGYVELSEHLDVEFIDPMSNPIETERHGIVTETGTVVILAGEDEQRLEARFTETALTTALVKLDSEEDHILCWTVGHGEADPDDDQTMDGFGIAVIRLEGRNYTVMKSRLPTEGIAEGCEALIIARPTVDWLPNAREALAAYIGKGGRVLMMLEPATTPELMADLERYGLLLQDDLVLEDSPAHRQFGHDVSSLVLFEDNFESHPITAPLSGSVVLSYARSVDPMPDADGLHLRTLLSSSEFAWTETDFDDPEKLGPGDDEKLGDVALAVAIEVVDPAVLGVSIDAQAAPAELVAEGLPNGEAPPLTLPSLVAPGWAAEPGGRLVVIGDSFPGTNAGISTGNNADLVFNSIAWLLEADDELTERAAETDQLLQLSIVQEAFLGLLSIVLVPGFAAFVAFLTMLRRRRL
ncbi:MAG: GldG family protein [Proteobacteria bacterium]|nr:GldG family protein [Pseudomonadota bacterium]